MTERSELLDRQLERDLDDVVRHDVRLCGLDLAVRFDGGVAHVEGVVPTDGHRELLRSTTARLRGVNAVWDRLVVDGEPAPRVVDIGCGGSKQTVGSIGVDRRPLPGVDVVGDLGHGLPLRRHSVDHLFAVHVLEHVVDLVALMDELHRVLVPGGVLHAMVPERRHVNAVADPTHVRFFDVQTFKYFCRGDGRALPWRPAVVACDGANVFADLVPLQPGDPLPGADDLARFFD